MSRDLGILVLRVGLGVLMLTHGWGKLMKLIEQGLDAGFADPLGIGEFPSLVLTVLAEFFCSILIIFGWKTRWVSIPLAFTMLIAAFVVHVEDPWARQELPLLYLTGYVCLIFTGSGKYAVDKN